MKMFALLSTLVSLSLVYSLPNGAPRCTVNVAGIQKGHGSPPDQTLGFTIEPTMSPTGMSFTFKNAHLNSFNGLLMYISSKSRPDMHLGEFSIDTGMFKFQDQALCTAANVSGSQKATITHANPKDKPISTRVWWTAGPGDSSIADLQLTAVVAAQPGKAQGGKPGTPRWQPIMMDLPTANATMSTMSTQMNQQAPVIFMCRPKTKMNNQMYKPPVQCKCQKNKGNSSYQHKSSYRHKSSHSSKNHHKSSGYTEKYGYQSKHQSSWSNRFAPDSSVSNQKAQSSQENTTGTAHSTDAHT